MVNARTVIRTFDLEKVQSVKYNGNGTYIYENSTNNSPNISYILPLRVKPNTRIVVKTKNNAKFDLGNVATGAIHYLGDVNPSTLTPRTILKTDCVADGNSIKYDNIYNDSEATFVIPEGCHAVELYLFEHTISTKTLIEDIYDILDFVSVVAED